VCASAVIVEKLDESDAERYFAKDSILTVNDPKGKDRLIAQLNAIILLQRCVPC
jgi:hypothetical protein